MNDEKGISNTLTCQCINKYSTTTPLLTLVIEANTIADFLLKKLNVHSTSS